MASCSSGPSASAPDTPQCGSGHLEQVIKGIKLSPLSTECDKFNKWGRKKVGNF